MNTEIVSDNQAISILVLFLIADALVYPMAVAAKKDLWIAIIVAILMAMPIQLSYVRLHLLFPKRDLINIMEFSFGKILGKMIALLFIGYISINCIAVISSFSEFITTVSFPETPKAILSFLFVLLCVCVVNEGIEGIGRFSRFFILIVVVLIVITILLLISEMEIKNIFPVLEYGIKPIIKGSFPTIIFPFTETITFTLIFLEFKSHRSPYKIYITGLIIAGLIILFTSLTEVLVLGINNYLSVYFPSYTAVARMNIGNLFQRLEVIVSVTYIIGGFVKISVLLLAITKIIVKMFNFENYRFLLVPIALIMANFSLFFFDNVMHLVEWLEIWYVIALLFQVILPITMWIIAEIRVVTTHN